jgi:hypothetical protein
VIGVFRAIWYSIPWIRAAKQAQEECDAATRRFNSPFCPSCGLSIMDMPEGSMSKLTDRVGQYKLKCPKCNRSSQWFDTGFMGVMGCLKGGKEYQLARGRDTGE